MLKPNQFKLPAEVLCRRCPQIAGRVQALDLSALAKDERRTNNFNPTVTPKTEALLRSILGSR